ncbi:hypothetical protein GMMP1_130045 [Candidatus Magnetomoraceae bacterium gMMP-1]
MAKFKNIILIILLFATVALLIFHFAKYIDAVQSRSDAVQPITVDVGKYEIRPVNEIIFAEGFITGEYRVTLSSPQKALIEDIYVKEGEKVKKNKLIAKYRLEPTIFEVQSARANLDAAQAQYHDAESRLTRKKQLYDSGIISFEEYLGYKMAHVQAKSNLVKVGNDLDILNIKLKEVEIFAPTSGIILHRHANPGERCSDIVTISVGKRFEAQVDELKSHLIYKGMPANIYLTSKKGKTLSGKVKRINPQINTKEYTLSIILSVESNPDELILGENGYCRMEIKRNVFTIPQSALINFSLDQALVFVIKDKIVKLRSIQFGVSSNGFTEVLSGLSEGELVVVSELSKINDGDTVLIRAIPQKMSFSITN